MAAVLVAEIGNVTCFPRPTSLPERSTHRPATHNELGCEAEKGLSVSSEFRVVIVDDDEFKRAGIRARLDATPEVAVVADVDQDIAASWPEDRWSDVDAVLVDIFDDRGVGERGTDLYSGIKVVDRVRPIKNLRCIAVTTSCAHPLVQLRLHQAGPDYCYHRFQLMDLEAVMEAVRFPERGRRLPPPDSSTIKSLGAWNLKANDVVRTYERSPLYPKLDAQAGIKELKAVGVERRAIDQFKQQIVGHGFNHLEAVRWPAVRTLVLRLLGRQDGPWSEHDKPW